MLLKFLIYGMIGWAIFGQHDPENYGNIGRAMETMFVMLTLENLPDYIKTGREVSEWSIVFFVSYAVIASFLIFNLFIGIVLNSMEEARELERRRALREAYGATAVPVLDPAAHAHVVERIAILRRALEDLELELAVGDGASRRSGPRDGVQ